LCFGKLVEGVHRGVARLPGVEYNDGVAAEAGFAGYDNHDGSGDLVVGAGRHAFAARILINWSAVNCLVVRVVLRRCAGAEIRGPRRG